MSEQPKPPAPPDTYLDASAVALGRWLAETYRGLREGGMSRAEALELLVRFLTATRDGPDQKP